MKISLTFLFCSLMIALSLGCGFSTEKRIPKALLEGLDQRSLKKISEAEILNAAERLGDSVTLLAQELLMGKLIEKIEEGSYASAVGFCSQNAQHITDSVGKVFSVGLKRISLKNRNESNQPNSLEQNLLEAYEYSAAEGQQLTTNVQFFQGDDSILYNKPIFIPSKLCLNCHGSKEDMDELTNAAIKEQYPLDEAHAYKVGDFRGLWSVSMSKRQLVKGLY